MAWDATVHVHDARMHYGHLFTIARYNVQITENDTAIFFLKSCNYNMYVEVMENKKKKNK